MLRAWRHSGFNLNASRRVSAEDRAGLESLLEYMERAAVALERLTLLENGRVLYRGNFHPGLGRDYQLLSGLEFLAPALPHVLLIAPLDPQPGVDSLAAAEETSKERHLLGGMLRRGRPGKDGELRLEDAIDREGRDLRAEALHPRLLLHPLRLEPAEPLLLPAEVLGEGGVLDSGSGVECGEPMAEPMMSRLLPGRQIAAPRRLSAVARRLLAGDPARRRR